MVDKVEELKNEITRIEEEYNRAQARSLFDRKLSDQLYKKLKKKKKELKGLTGEKA